MDEAIQIASRLPMTSYGSVEVRPILGIDLRQVAEAHYDSIAYDPRVILEFGTGRAVCVHIELGLDQPTELDRPHHFRSHHHWSQSARQIQFSRRVT